MSDTKIASMVLFAQMAIENSILSIEIDCDCYFIYANKDRGTIKINPMSDYNYLWQADTIEEAFAFISGYLQASEVKA